MNQTPSGEQHQVIEGLLRHTGPGMLPRTYG
jgi:hypothetical protein